MKMTDESKKPAAAAETGEETKETARDAEAQLNDGDLDKVSGGEADGEWKYRTATNDILNQIGTGPYCPICREILRQFTDYANRVQYYACTSCRIQWEYHF